MTNTCDQCGAYRADQIVDPDGPYAVCPECGHRRAFLMLPLFAIGGASGAGKSAVGSALYGKMSEVVLLEGDLLWRPEFDKPDEKYREFFETWLRVCKNISQAGRPVALLNAGIAVPENLEDCVERRYFSRVRYLALVCSDAALKDRLAARPSWRKSDPAIVGRHLEFNAWLKENAAKVAPAIELLDTTDTPVAETARQVADWIGQGLGELRGRTT
jgi:DNA-directed RNA polymerase subunit RPC12/RpoP